MVIICIVMTFALAGFFLYHARLAWANETTNESFKREDISKKYEFEDNTLQELIDEVEAWKPSAE